MNPWLIRLIILAVLLVGFLYFYGLSKNVAETERRHKKDMTGKLNPYTGNIMPDAIEEEERLSREEAEKKASSESNSDETDSKS